VRKYLHKPNEQMVIDNQQTSLSMLDTDPAVIDNARQRKNQRFFSMNARQGIAAGVGSYALEEPAESVLSYFRNACADFAEGLKLGLAVDPTDFGLYLSAASICGDRMLTLRLAGMRRSSFSNPNVECEEILYIVAEFHAGLALGHDSLFQERLSAGEQLLKAGPTSRPVLLSVQGLVGIARAIADRDEKALDRAVEARQKDYVQMVRKPSIREMPEALLDLWGLGILRLGAERGTRPTFESVYLPLELI
jgi:hypothetical protein